ncbi:glycosyltransferase family 4 protein [Pseudoroseicyclus aestuarii]|uniref:Glycosyltransferase involved in cell wall biosynthesis n=1 Tax=Pseudoroseicyclus aestuarii TaxID=1795041 RepID=A0A318SQI3_9RHOB|nr:glycosyltransferase family 4 protein [Pseudoroseicyclus aestuarii]PYE83685.1 glycosyltransferase involved in cell wall biosynthesis [Pseudoroseicyclus aestuarii]
MTRVLMTLDAVGGVWRYALDLAQGLRAEGLEIAFAGLGPAPSPAQAEAARRIGTLDWGEAPLDWLAKGPEALAPVGPWLSALAERRGADLVHLNYPSQGAELEVAMPVVAASHSCLATWFAAVRGSAVPDDMAWQAELTGAGLRAADAALVPSAAHAKAMGAVYEGLPRIAVVHNASLAPEGGGTGEDYVFAAARWWDAGKNAAVLDAAAEDSLWPVTMAGATEGPDGSHAAIHYAGAPGPLEHGQAMGLLRQAGLFVSPSLYEPFGLAALEAARAQRPLLLADIPTYRELWDGAAAFFDPVDPPALRGAINALAADAPRRAALGRAARERARRYSLQAQVAAVLDLYRTLGVRAGQAAA